MMMMTMKIMMLQWTETNKELKELGLIQTNLQFHSKRSEVKPMIRLG
jgi:predicted transcriptional regulator